MKSTLPALFRPKSKQSTHQTSIIRPRSEKASPQKQSSFYNLKLDQQYLYYRTKIINPHHQKSTLPDKLPQSSRVNFKQRYAEYPSRSLSVHGSYDGQVKNMHSTLDIDRTMELNVNKSTISYSFNNSKSLSKSIYNTQQQVDNPTQLLKQLTHRTILLQRSVQQLPNLNYMLQERLQGIKNKMENQIGLVEQEGRQRIKGLWDLLSLLRRETNVELKGMRKEVEDLGAQIEEEKLLLGAIQNQRVTIRNVNF